MKQPVPLDDLQLLSRAQDWRREHRNGVLQRPRVAGLVLAAGGSRRMGQANKLLQPWRGEALVRHVVRAVVKSGAAPVYLVVGHQAEAVIQATEDLPVMVVHNPDHAEGLSSSLRAGLCALPDEIDGVLVALGDMPRVNPRDLGCLQAAFDPNEGRAICVPTYQGKRGNPVLLGRQLFAELQRLEGDRGARSLIGGHEDLVTEVAVEGAGVLLDVDTPAALEQLRRGAARAS
ncbi:MAG: nucleotidyltransferase family protein [Halomonas sp.]|uniref:nucleotidyltransferase family protein n=1 Tax=Halomonas sp. TaxID=1486246 RepID=UPI00287059B0|nr:nucleotidyltransferase family protein [Halomonas sp.]MDR9438363.1 nucleotidyltransferase family protein [Halomonas sp.]